MVIRVLDPEVINQIAAGEVVERPFSVLKECIENSLDAGATRIEVDLEEGGRSLIRIRDDGRGMGEEDMKLVFASHATSKLSRLEDLERVVSLGFRGEAMASIGSVARVRILSRPEDSEEGFEVRAEAGRILPVVPAAAPPGTLVEVRELFYNVPARRRFLKTPQGERARCVEVFTKLALANPDCGFVLSGPRPLRLPAGESLRERVRGIYGEKIAASCHEVSYERGGLRVGGLVGDPDIARRDKSQELLYLNGRPIKDRSCSYAIKDAYAEYLMGGRYPVAFLFVTMDPSLVDVNVHPTKSEVRFTDPRLVFSVLRQAVREGLGDRIVRLRERAEGSIAEAANSGPQPVTGFPDLPKGLFGGSDGTRLPSMPAPKRQEPLVRDGAPGFERSAIEGAALSEEAETDRRRLRTELRHFARAGRFLQIRNLYLLFETESGFAVVDQHALHERVLYEKLLASWREGSVPVQRLLLPVVVDLAPAQKERLLEHATEFERVGLLLGDFGGNSVKLEGYPAALKRVDAKQLIEGFLQELEDGDKIREPEDVRERFHHAACRAAIMAGDALSDEEIASLLEQASDLEHPDNCPHGRPTVLNFSFAQLERWFKRVL